MFNVSWKLISLNEAPPIKQRREKKENVVGLNGENKTLWHDDDVN